MKCLEVSMIEVGKEGVQISNNARKNIKRKEKNYKRG